MSAADILAEHLNSFLLLLVLLLLLQILRVLLQTQKKNEVVTRDKTQSEPESQGDFENILDFVLGFVSRSLTTHCAKLQVPDIQRSFHAIGNFFQCDLWVTNGVLEDIPSLFRDGPARVLKTVDEELIVDAAVGLRNIALQYNDYSLSVGNFSVSGSLKANVAPASLRMRVLVRQPFVVELHSLRVENLGPLKMDITGLGLGRFMLPCVEILINQNVFAFREVALQHLSYAIEDTLYSFSRKIETIPQMIFPSENSEVTYSMEHYKRKREVEIRRPTFNDTVNAQLGYMLDSLANAMTAVGISEPRKRYLTAIPIKK